MRTTILLLTILAALLSTTTTHAQTTPVPTGTVTFYDGATLIGTVTLVNGTVPPFSTSALTVGSHSIIANYSGDANYAPSVGQFTQVVNAVPVKINTATIVMSSLNPATVGQSITFTATVSPSTATGSVSFKDGATLLGGSTISGGKATLPVTTLAAGPHSITGTYSGDATYAASTSAPLAQIVNPVVAGTCPGPATGAFTGCYYPNITLAGTPVLVRTDTAINFAWRSASPGAGLAGKNFSALWQGNFSFTAGTHAFTMITSDGMHVYIDGALCSIPQAWRNQSPTSYTFSKTLTAGTHLIVVDYYEQSGNAEVELLWK